MEKLEIGFFASADFKWEGRLIMVNHHVVQSEMVMKGIGPELGQKVGIGEHSMKSITYHLVRALAWPILVGQVHSQRFHTAACFLEQFNKQPCSNDPAHHQDRNGCTHWGHQWEDHGKSTND
jgi:hypothetical protein